MFGDLEAEQEPFGIDDRAQFAYTIVARLADERASYDQVVAINWGAEALSRTRQPSKRGRTILLRTDESNVALQWSVSPPCTDRGRR